MQSPKISYNNVYQKVNDMTEYAQAGSFLKAKRKAQGFKTQKVFIQALQKLDPELTCSESYISLIEKGVKSPSIYLLDIMAQVLQLTPPEKGELLLIYKRVPSDFEFAVRSNIKESLQQTRLDILRTTYTQNPTRESFQDLVRALVLEERTQEALDLLQDTAPFSGDFVEMQARTAYIAGLTGNYPFAAQAFELALSNCSSDDAPMRSYLFTNLGIVYFHQGLRAQNSDPLLELEYYLRAESFLRQALALTPDKLFTHDELARCLYHAADALQQCQREQLKLKPKAQEHPQLHQQLQQRQLKPPVAADHPALKAWSYELFTASSQLYQQILAQAHTAQLPEKPLKEAAYFHAYTYAKLQQFALAEALLNTNLLLDRNWLTCFMKAGFHIMRFEADNNPIWLDAALADLELALEYEPEAVKSMIRSERNRELKSLWAERAPTLEALLNKEYEP
jgi:transcriptional regulator with XRE-family HTH domain